MAVREAFGTDGTSIVYRVDGPADGTPLVLLHGWAQSMACWGDAVIEPLTEKYRVVAVDLRGHGYSGAPAGGYDDPQIWAGDVAAVLNAENITSGAVLLGWSYGGLVLCDYLSVFGSDAVGGVVLVAAITSIGRGEQGGRVGHAMRAAIPGAMSEESRVAIRALGSFGNALTGPGPGLGERAQALFGASLSTRPRVRAAVFDRAISHDAVLTELDVPALVIHGTDDSIVDISAGRWAAELIQNARGSWWEGVDHGPFVADPGRFVAEVTEFVEALAPRAR